MKLTQTWFLETKFKGKGHTEWAKTGQKTEAQDLWITQQSCIVELLEHGKEEMVERQKA